MSTPKVKWNYEECRIVTNLAMNCPLCGIRVSPMIEHCCSRKQELVKPKRTRKSKRTEAQ